MTTIDTHAAGIDTPATAPRGRRRVASARTSSVGEWLTTTDHKRIGRLFIGVSLVGLLGVIVVAALLGIERIDAEAAMLDINSIPQLFSLYRIGLTFVVLVPLLLGLAIAVVPLQLGARSLTFPRLAAAGFWTWFVGAVSGRHLDRRQRWPVRAATASSSALFLVSHIVVAARPRRRRRIARHHRAHHSCAGHEHAPRPAVRLVGADRRARSAAGASAVIGALIYTYVDYRNGRVGFGGNLAINDGSASASPSRRRFVYAVPVVRVRRRGDRRRQRSQAADARCHLHRHRSRRDRRRARRRMLQQPAELVARHQPLSASVCGSATSCRTRFFNLLPVLGGFIVISLGALALRSSSSRGSSHRLVFGLLGALMVFVGIARQRRLSRRRRPARRHRLRRRRVALRRVRRACSAHSAQSPTGARSCGAGRSPTRRRLPLAVSGFIATVARRIAVSHRRVRQAACQRHRVRLLGPAEPVERAVPLPAMC